MFHISVGQPNGGLSFPELSQQFLKWQRPQFFDRRYARRRYIPPPRSGARRFIDLGTEDEQMIRRAATAETAPWAEPSSACVSRGITA